MGELPRRRDKDNKSVIPARRRESICRCALELDCPVDCMVVSVILIRMKPKETIEGFDSFLARRGLLFEAVVIGGAALGLLGVVSRQTRDCDVLHPRLPEVIRNAAREYAGIRRKEGDILADDWLNNGPSSLTDVLPPGWMRRLQVVYAGKAITLQCLGRVDLLRSKLFALCDRGIDLQDCAALAPSIEELEEIAPWLEIQDTNPDWPEHTRAVLDDLRKRLGHGV